MRRIRLAVVAAVLGVLVLAGCSGPAIDIGEPVASDAGVQLFQLPWTSVADECTKDIGPNGFAFVLVSPPQEHITGPQWWTSYQPVSYQLASKLGTRDEFAEMVATCRAAGVDVIADAVINHMTGQTAGGTGFAGTVFQHYEYPGLYTKTDFHHCGLTPDDDIADYGSREQVQNCELLNLADLDTGSPTVRATITAYLDDLLSLGVAGFRIDAAKHIAATQVQAIVDGLPAGTRIMSEVIRGSASEPIQPEEYTGIGQVFEFQYARDLGPNLEAGIVNDPSLEDPRPQHVPSASAVVFVDNHDTERGEAAVTYRDGPLYLIANVLMLADDYGTPVVYSGYAFSDKDAGAPQDAQGRVLPALCAGISGPKASYDDGDRTCTQAWTAVAGMLRFRAGVGTARRRAGVTEGDAYGFEREGRGAVAVNTGAATATLAVPTSLPAGIYCDLIEGGRDSAGACRGGKITVADGTASFSLGPVSAAAIDILDRQG